MLPTAKSVKAARDLVANARTASRPRSGECIEYSKRISGAASSSITAGLKSEPQNSVNQCPMIAYSPQSTLHIHPSNRLRKVPGMGSCRVDGPKLQNVRIAAEENFGTVRTGGWGAFPAGPPAAGPMVECRERSIARFVRHIRSWPLSPLLRT